MVELRLENLREKGKSPTSPNPSAVTVKRYQMLTDKKTILKGKCKMGKITPKAKNYWKITSLHLYFILRFWKHCIYFCCALHVGYEGKVYENCIHASRIALKLYEKDSRFEISIRTINPYPKMPVKILLLFKVWSTSKESKPWFNFDFVTMLF